MTTDRQTQTVLCDSSPLTIGTCATADLVAVRKKLPYHPAWAPCMASHLRCWARNCWCLTSGRWDTKKTSWHLLKWRWFNMLSRCIPTDLIILFSTSSVQPIDPSASSCWSHHQCHGFFRDDKCWILQIPKMLKDAKHQCIKAVLERNPRLFQIGLSTTWISSLAHDFNVENYGEMNGKVSPPAAFPKH